MPALAPRLIKWYALPSPPCPPSRPATTGLLCLKATGNRSSQQSALFSQCATFPCLLHSLPLLLLPIPPLLFPQSQELPLPPTLAKSPTLPSPEPCSQNATLSSGTTTFTTLKTLTTTLSTKRPVDLTTPASIFADAGLGPPTTGSWLAHIFPAFSNSAINLCLDRLPAQLAHSNLFQVDALSFFNILIVHFLLH